MTCPSPVYRSDSPLPGSPVYSPNPGNSSPHYDPNSPVLSTIESPTSPISKPTVNWRDYLESIPHLPSPRSRALTPTGFGDTHTQEQQNNVAALFQTSLWFRIPPYIRQDILRLAFGNRRLHMCLKLDAAPSPSWHSSGMVCHRVSSEDKGPMTRGSLKTGPWVDDCGSPGHETEHIGVMGWLLSCRQNYAETIDILYSTNTILIYDEPLVTHLNAVILPQRLAVITSLELKWPLTTTEYLGTLFDSISPPQLPSLKRVYVSLVHPEEPCPGLSWDQLRSQLDNFVKNRPGLTECTFALPFDKFEFAAGTLVQKDSSWERNTYSQVWRSLDGEMHVIRLPYTDSYPSPPFQLGPNPGSGYWLLEGTDAPLTWRWRSSSHAFSGVFVGWEDWSENGNFY